MGNSVFIEESWYLKEGIAIDNGATCKVCNSREGLRYLVFPKDKKAYGLFLCTECVSGIVPLFIEELKNIYKRSPSRTPEWEGERNNESGN